MSRGTAFPAHPMRGADSACRAFAAALAAGQVDVAASCFLRDGCLITPGATAVHGREDICLVLAQLVALCAEVEVESTGLTEAGGAALVHQRWKLALSAPESEAAVQITAPTFVLRRVEADWKLAIAAPWGTGGEGIATARMGGSR